MEQLVVMVGWLGAWSVGLSWVGVGVGAVKSEELLAGSLPLDYQAYMADRGILMDVQGILTTAQSQSHCFQLAIQMDAFIQSILANCSTGQPESDYCKLSRFEQDQVNTAAQRIRSAFRRSLKKEAPLVNIVSDVIQAMKDPSAIVTLANDGQVSLIFFLHYIIYQWCLF